MSLIGDFQERGHATSYSLFRPVYPQSVGQIISSYMESNNCTGYERAVDVCCGSGQSTMLLAQLFDSVCGYDNSQEQISQAKSKQSVPRGNVTFQVGDAHNLPIESSSVDLLTCAMGWHWLDAERFYSEAKRVLKPRGCIAVYGYNITVNDNELVGALVEAFKQEMMQNDCMDERSLQTLNEYKSVELPFSGTQRLKFDLPQKSSVEHLFGFFESFSSYTAYCKKVPGNNFLQTLRETYKGQWSGDTAVEKFTYPGFIILGVNEDLKLE